MAQSVIDFCSLRKDCARERLITAVQRYFPSSVVYPFSTARGSLAAALIWAGIKEGDEVILSAFTCLAVPTAVIAAGGRPVYVDIRPETLNTEAELLRMAITESTKAIVLQHTLGNPADIVKFLQIIGREDIVIIEDCALSIGARINNKFSGSFAHAAIFSMELSKTLSCGWGGILLINDERFFSSHRKDYENTPVRKLLPSLKDMFQTLVSSACHIRGIHFIGKYAIFVFFKLGIFRYSNAEDEISLRFRDGFVFRMRNNFARLAAIQWKRLDYVVNRCENVYDEIRQHAAAKGYFIPDAPFYTSIFIRLTSPRISFFVRNKARFISFFMKNGFEVGLWFDGPLTPMPDNAAFAYEKKDYPSALFVANHIVNLPCHSRMTYQDISKLKECLTEFASQNPHEIKFT